MACNNRCIGSSRRTWSGQRHSDGEDEGDVGTAAPVELAQLVKCRTGFLQSRFVFRQGYLRFEIEIPAFLEQLRKPEALAVIPKRQSVFGITFRPNIPLIGGRMQLRRVRSTYAKDDPCHLCALYRSRD